MIWMNDVRSFSCFVVEQTLTLAKIEFIAKKCNEAEKTYP